VADERSPARPVGSQNPESDSLGRLWLARCSISLGTRGKKGSGRLGINRRYVFVSNFYSTVARVVADIANVQKPNYRGAGSAYHCLLVGR
jgi:hypothetical protein